MSLKNLTKARLVEIAQQLNLKDEGTKVVLEDRIVEHFDNHPELEEHAEFKKFVQFRQRNSPVKTTQSEDIASSPSKAIPALSEKITSSPSRLLALGQRFRTSFSSPLKTNKPETEDDASDDDDDDNDDDDDDNSDVEILSTEQTGNDDIQEEEKGESFNLVSSAKEWFADQGEKIQDWYYDGSDWVVEKSNNTKKYLSKAETVNILTTIVELSVLANQQVPWTQLKNVSYLDQKILSKYTKYIDLNTSVPDLAVFFELKTVLVFLTWVLLAVIVPVVGSYYFNFIGKKHKKTKYDPLVFNLIKLLLAYFLLSGTVSFDDIKNNAEVWADENGILSSATVLQRVKAHTFHNQLTLSLILGNLPFVNGLVGVLVALYVAAI